jgi:holo-[acyl-carrier protein] synthase
MIIGIGVDIVNISRVDSWRDNKALLNKYFSDNEITYCFSRGVGFAASLAARFAAKEAFSKALGTGLVGIKLKDIEVSNDETGKPELLVTGSAADEIKKRGVKNIFLSLSHEKEYAVAYLILEG